MRLPLFVAVLRFMLHVCVGCMCDLCSCFWFACACCKNAFHNLRYVSCVYGLVSCFCLICACMLVFFVCLCMRVRLYVARLRF